jgi:hypothetical protein
MLSDVIYTRCASMLYGFHPPVAALPAIIDADHASAPATRVTAPKPKLNPPGASCSPAGASTFVGIRVVALRLSERGHGGAGSGSLTDVFASRERLKEADLPGTVLDRRIASGFGARPCPGADDGPAMLTPTRGVAPEETARAAGARPCCVLVGTLLVLEGFLRASGVGLSCALPRRGEADVRFRRDVTESEVDLGMRVEMRDAFRGEKGAAFLECWT